MGATFEKIMKIRSKKSFRRWWVKLCCRLLKPCCVSYKLCSGSIKLCCRFLKPCCGSYKLCSGSIKLCCRFLKLCCGSYKLCCGDLLSCVMDLSSCVADNKIPTNLILPFILCCFYFSRVCYIYHILRLDVVIYISWPQRAPKKVRPRLRNTGFHPGSGDSA